MAKMGFVSPTPGPANLRATGGRSLDTPLKRHGVASAAQLGHGTAPVPVSTPAGGYHLDIAVVRHGTICLVALHHG
jgi:hypothetical protein